MAVIHVSEEVNKSTMLVANTFCTGDCIWLLAIGHLDKLANGYYELSKAISNARNITV